MTHDWLLVETLGDEPAVVAKGRRSKNLVPIGAYLRRNPHRAAIATAIAETVEGGTSLTSITSKSNRVIRTEPVRMSDGHVHGVHIWNGPPDAEPPDRPIPGPLIWNLTTGVATDTPESLSNGGLDPSAESTHGRAFAEDLPARHLNPNETQVLSLAIRSSPGTTLCSTFDFIDRMGELITVAFVARANLEPADDGSEHLIARAMNWRGVRESTMVAPDNLAQRILDALAEPGAYRVLVDLRHWKLLKWLDEPCPLYDWRGSSSDAPVVHPDDEPALAIMTSELEVGRTAAILRLRGLDGGWTPIHVTVNRVELDTDTFAGLVTLRLPTPAEQADH